MKPTERRLISDIERLERARNYHLSRFAESKSPMRRQAALDALDDTNEKLRVAWRRYRQTLARQA